MDERQLTRLMDLMVAAWPAALWSESTLATYRRFLSDLPSDLARSTVEDLVMDSPERPAIASIRRAVIEQLHDIPTAEEAYAAIMAGATSDERFSLARNVRDELGGAWNFKTSDEPARMRGVFVHQYRERREAELRKLNASSHRAAA